VNCHSASRNGTIARCFPRLVLRFYNGHPFCTRLFRLAFANRFAERKSHACLDCTSRYQHPISVRFPPKACPESSGGSRHRAVTQAQVQQCPLALPEIICKYSCILTFQRPPVCPGFDSHECSQTVQDSRTVIHLERNAFASCSELFSDSCAGRCWEPGSPSCSHQPGTAPQPGKERNQRASEVHSRLKDSWSPFHVTRHSAGWVRRRAPRRCKNHRAWQLVQAPESALGACLTPKISKELDRGCHDYRTGPMWSPAPGRVPFVSAL